MKKSARVIAALLLSTVIVPRAAQLDDAPDLRLILLVSVDQFRYDYLTRFRADYTEGLEQLLSQGAVFTNTNLEHYPTVTAVGHATMLTGAIPAVSGIIGNDWYDRESQARVTSVSDANEELIGGSPGPGVSPRRLLVTTVGDELKLISRGSRDAGPTARVIGVSLKPRSAVLMAGRAADAAYWFDLNSGAFVSSTYYFREPPDWLTTFNRRRRADAYAERVWEVPGQSEHALPDEPGPDLYTAVYSSPFGNDLLLAFAEAAMTEERLGQRGVTDVLAVGFSVNDTIGHSFGPHSGEVRDVSLRTDHIVGQLLERVDALVGLEHTLIAFTSDHGVAPLPEVLDSLRLPGGRLRTSDLVNPVEQALVDHFGPGPWVKATAGSSMYLDDELIVSKGLDPVDVHNVAARSAATAPHVSRVYTREQLHRGDVATDRFSQRVLNGFNTQRSGDLEILLEPNWIRQAQGTTHGTPYGYDAHIPLILMGAAIRPGSYTAAVSLNDLAPTLSTLAGVEIPSGSSGRVLTEAMR